MTQTNTHHAIHQALHTVIDPELGYSITDLGLVYGVQHTGEQVTIDMTLTSPVCPLQETFRQNIQHAIQGIYPSATVHVNFTFTPPWSLEKATPQVREELALKGIPLTRW